MATSQQVAQMFGNAICKPARTVRVTASAKRKAVAAAQIEALTAAIADIRGRAREMPAWAHGYNSAITAIEMQISKIAESA